MGVLSEIVLPVCAPRSTGLDFLGSGSTPLSEALEPPTLERPLLGLHGGMAEPRVTSSVVSVNRQIDHGGMLKPDYAWLVGWPDRPENRVVLFTIHL
jgi:hypothetical protein